MSTFKKIANDHKETVPSLIVIIIFTISMVTIRGYLFDLSSHKSQAWMSSRVDSSKTISALLAKERLQEKDSMYIRLSQQLETVENRKEMHASIMKEYYSRHYTSITMAAIVGLLAAAMLAMISRVGWDRAQRFVKTTFLMASGTAAFFAASPGMYKQAETINANMLLFLSHENLQEEIMTYTVTERSQSGEEIKPEQFLLYVDSTLASLNQVPISFDDTQLPVGQEAFQALSN